MSRLPTLETPTYTMKIPSSGKKVRYRPFLTKEEKILLIAFETGNEEDLITAVKTLISNCTFGEVDPSTLAKFDIEYMFLHIRAKSVGEICEPVVVLDDENGKKHEIKLKINIEDIEVYTDPNHTKDIQIQDNVVIRMKYPTLDTGASLADEESGSIDQIFDTIIDCIDQIFFGEQSWNADDLDRKEIEQFVDSLTKKQFDMIVDFFRTIPVLRKDIEVTVGEKKHSISITGLESFFDYASVTQI